MSCGELGKWAKTGEEVEPIIDHDLMTLRDYFAAKAMQGFITNHDTRRSDLIDVPQLAKSAYYIADAMIEERE